jgi:hypothetical protein
VCFDHAGFIFALLLGLASFLSFRNPYSLLEQHLQMKEISVNVLIMAKKVKTVLSFPRAVTLIFLKMMEHHY